MQPMPVSMAEAEELDKSIKKPRNRRLRSIITANSITAMPAHNSTLALQPSLIRSFLPAPRFCAVQVDTAFPQAMNGIIAKESIFEAAVYPASTSEPKGLTADCTINIPTDTTDCCITDTAAQDDISFNTAPEKKLNSALSWSFLYTLSVRSRNDITADTP